MLNRGFECCVTISEKYLKRGTEAVKNDIRLAVMVHVRDQHSSSLGILCAW